MVLLLVVLNQQHLNPGQKVAKPKGNPTQSSPELRQKDGYLDQFWQQPIFYNLIFFYRWKLTVIRILKFRSGDKIIFV